VDYVCVAAEIHARDRALPIVLVNDASSEQRAIQALRAGVADYLEPSSSCEEIAGSVARVLAARDEACATAARSSSKTPGVSALIGSTARIREIRAQLERVARTSSNVLIVEETGTGKELAAAILHHASPRRSKELVCINCAAIPDNLLESELFGYERGAFTGANSGRPGLMQHADGATVVLDEIADMSLHAQAKVLRMIDYKEVRPVGGRQAQTMNVRIIAATHGELQTRIAEGRFRADLYYRLNVACVRLPPLRERREDIPLLLEHYIGVLNKSHKRNGERFSDDALACMMRYDWPGNVRDLRNVVEAIYIDQPDRVILPAQIPDRIRWCGAADTTGHCGVGPAQRVDRKKQ
jgi:DNA-binding NtrC family response regulator